ncbi:MAG: hypothetical protein NC307_05510 [Roseburia sp.]|nr:hypothetical protein [Roseburia sp.]
MDIKERNLTLEQVRDKYPNKWVMLTNIEDAELNGIASVDVVEVYPLDNYPGNKLDECISQYGNGMILRTAKEEGVLFL